MYATHRQQVSSPIVIEPQRARPTLSSNGTFSLFVLEQPATKSTNPTLSRISSPFLRFCSTSLSTARQPLCEDLQHVHDDTQIRNSADRKLCDTSRIQCVLSARLHSNQIPLSWKIGEPATNRGSLARVMDRDTNLESRLAGDRVVFTELGDEAPLAALPSFDCAETSRPLPR
jgi:hypothetical protein